jgi:hypothetical protein
MKRKRLFIIIVNVVLLSSCATVYVPNAANVPLIGEQGELQAGISTGTSNIDVQAAYGMSDKMALMINTTFSNRDDSVNYHEHWMYEGAIGYYKKTGRAGRLEVYGGGGYGYTMDNGINGNFSGDFASGHYAKMFLQANVGATTHVFDGVMSMRICETQFYDYKYQNIEYGSENNLFLEPVLTGKIGYKNIKFMTQIGFSIPVFQSDIVSFNPFIFNIGLNFKINTIKHKSVLN